ncbi:hypothetical protein PPYR_05711 [Photinus pyralis]|uniref:Hexosyltransferase n=1 Tax=Photinus pyralis TaxID=7054 RepID=A0A5N4AVL0_PHOPY|nr:hypothetical protein PPYR_05711 [Photinus pyralis]
MLGWVKDYCPRVKFVLKCDDDVFINVPRLLKYISTLKLWKRAIWGHISKNSIPSRLKEGKRYVSHNEYNYAVYPSYVMGHAYLIPVGLVEELCYTSLHLRYLFKLEDILLTGIVATILQIPKIHNDKFQNAVMVKPCVIERSICVHGVSEKQQFDFWKKVRGKNKC